MGLCLRFSLVSSLLLVSSLFSQDRGLTADETAAPDQKQADLCELLREGHEDLLNEYPNEYYDCHAHSRFFKLSSLTLSTDDKKPS
ncbi:MAG: hypothetical protein V4655_09390 [Bdellovibrionota bacterium]|nr:MAG: hypothetical protein EOP10_19700 [Pseudomonadota bacterium]